MRIVHAKEKAPTTYTKSVFLVGPTPRTKSCESWRPAMIEALEDAGYDGVVFVPERSGGVHDSYIDQVEWEKEHLEMADVILAWVPRQILIDVEHSSAVAGRSYGMPAFTTNVEFGTFIDSGKLIYGRPENAEKCRYLDWLYKDRQLGEPHSTMASIAEAVVKRLGTGAERNDGERYVPFHIWNTRSFQGWHHSQRLVGNRLDGARLLWSFKIPKTDFLFSFVLWVKVWIEAEQRHKENEFIFTRTDISSILPFHINIPLGSRGVAGDVWGSKVVLIREFRSPVRNADCFVHELPGGSSFKGIENAMQIVSDELKEETGLILDPSRFVYQSARQLAATLCTHKSHLFTVRLTDEELVHAQALAKNNSSFGVTEDTERTYVEVKTLREVMLTNELDWSMLGMLFQGMSEHIL